MSTKPTNLDQSSQLVSLLKERNELLATVESCTGGMVGSMLTSISGASDVYVGGAITYSNWMKCKCVEVRSDTLEQYGAVSSQTAVGMSQGALNAFEADVAIAITGIAGPNGGTPDKPVGTVWISVAHKNLQPDTRRFVFSGDRESVRQSATHSAIEIAIQCLLQDFQSINNEQERIVGYTHL
ncbi:MAG: CinA family protein [Phycisphaerales bacterium]|nr:CinA family protein [Phycisphaerales bacterium]